MSNSHNKVYLFIHAIWTVQNRLPVLTKPIRTILFATMQKTAEERGIKIVAVNGVEDHVHCLLQMHPAQNLSQLIKSVKGESAQWLNGNKLLAEPFEWQEEYLAYSVSPSGVKQVIDFISKQEEHHKTKALESELEAFSKMPV